MDTGVAADIQRVVVTGQYTTPEPVPERFAGTDNQVIPGAVSVRFSP